MWLGLLTHLTIRLVLYLHFYFWNYPYCVIRITYFSPLHNHSFGKMWPSRYSIFAWVSCIVYSVSDFLGSLKLRSYLGIRHWFVFRTLVCQYCLWTIYRMALLYFEFTCMESQKVFDSFQSIGNFWSHNLCFAHGCCFCID